MDTRLPETDPTSADAEWKKIQQNTFTRWCNEHLKLSNQYIYSLETDLCDGLKLISLLEVLAHKRVGKHNKKPIFKSQRMENIAIALRFIESENIRLVNIDASDIFKGNLKLILGLIWTLILKYQISIPMMDDDFDSGMTPKQALLAWVKSKMPPTVSVDNFTGDWNDGKVLACLVDAVAPGLMPDCEDLSPKDALDNVKEAMKLAEDWLGVPQILDPADLVNPKVDELSVMTYVSYFPEAKCRPGAPLRPKLQPSAKCSASGPGLQPRGVRAKLATTFNVFTHGAGAGKISVHILGPQRKEVHVAIKDNGDDSFLCEYVPLEPGTYDIHVKWVGRHIPKSPFRVEVSPDYDPTQCYAQGPGLEPTGIVAGKYTHFEVFTAHAGEGNLQVEVIDPRGGKDVDVVIEDKKDGSYYVEYQPVNSGRHNVNIKFGGKHIPKSPYHVMVMPPPQPSKVKAFGQGIEPTGQKANKPAPFTIDAKSAGNGDLDVFVEGPFGEEKVDIKDNGDGTYACCYYPTKHGSYVVSITWSGQQIPKSPFNVKVGAPVDKGKIVAYGPGLEKGTAGQRCDFTVETKGAGVDSLGFAIEGPSQAEIKCVDKGNGSCDVSYFPMVPGKYAVHVTYCEEDINNSPFMVPIAPPGEASKCWAEGPGLEPVGVVAGNPAEFTVHTEDAGIAELAVDVLDDHGKKAKVDIKDNRNGTYTCIYYPTQPGRYSVNVTYGGKEIPKSPFDVTVSPKTDPNKVTAEGPGIEPKGVKARERTWFTVNTKEAGLGSVEVTVKPDGRGKAVDDVTVKDNGDGTYTVEYLAPSEGAYLITVLFAGKAIKRSPYRVQVSPGADASKCKPRGDGLKVAYVDQLATFDVDCTKAGEGLLTASVDNPSGAHTDTLVNDHQDGTYTIEYTPFEAGPHKVSVKYAGQHIPGSTYTVDVLAGPDATKCKAYGPGLEQGFTNVPNPFTVETKDAGPGGLSLAVEGPSEAKLDCVDNGDGTCSVNYVPVEAGDYDIHIKYADEHIPGSPFNTKVVQRVEPGLVKCYGPGLEADVYSAGPNEFMVDAREAGDADLDVTLQQPDGKSVKPEVEKVADGMYSVRYVPKKKGPHTINVKYAGQAVPRSPFRVNAGEPFDAKKVKVSGPGVEKPVDCDEVAEFYADCSEAGFAPFGVAMDSPSGGPGPEPEIIDEGNGKYTIRYEPEEVGTYNVNVKYGDKHVPRSPFRVKSNPVGDPNKVRIVGPGLDGRPLKVGEKAVFKIDARNAGKGKPRVAVTTASGKDVPVEVIDNGDGTYAVEFTPFEPGMLTFDMKYGGRSVPGYPKTLPVQGDKADLDKVKAEFVEDIETLMTGQTLEMEIDTTDAGIPAGCQESFTATVKTPSGDVEPAGIVDNFDGTYSVEYIPQEPGVYYLTVKYDGVPLPNSPFRFEVQGEGTGGADKVVVFGKGLERGIANEPCEFTVVTRDAGPGGLSLAVEGPGKSEITCIDNEDGSCAVSYVPIEPGEYHVVVKFADEHVPGSPFTARIYLSKDDIDADMRTKPIVGKPCDVGLEIPDVDLARDLKDIKTHLKRPNSDTEEPIDCRINPDGTLGVTFTPYEPGEHLISVKKFGRHVNNSPFSVMVQAPRLGDICPVGHPCEVGVDLPDVVLPNEFKKLTASLRRPRSKADETVKLNLNPDDTVSFSFIPRNPGEHFLTIKKDGKPVKGSPFSILVESEEPIKAVTCPVDCALDSDDLVLPDDFKKLKGTIKRPSGKADEPLNLKLNSDNSLSCSFVPNETGPHQVDIKKNNRPIADSPYTIRVISEEPVHEVGRPLGVGLELPKGCVLSDIKYLEAKLKRPSGEPEPVRILLNSDNTLAVHFTPREVGPHYIYVTKQGRPVMGSPFKVDVVSRDRVEEVHPVGRTCDIGLDIPGIRLPDDFHLLKSTLKRPNSEKIEPLKLELNPDNTLGVSFVPREPGGHLIGVTKSGAPVTGSPFLVMVEAAEAVNAVGRPCDCILDIAGLKGDDISRLTASLKRPTSKQEEPLKLKVNSDNSISVSFVPREPGEHLISVKKMNSHVSGSPFTVMVTDSLSQSIGRPCGLGLEIPGIKLPEDFKYLTATLMRPSSTASEPLKLTLNSDNTLGVSFVPQESGEHFIGVKKNSRDVSGSPFSVMVSGPGPADASKVKCTGAGLEYGFAGQPANFSVNTKDAGYGGLGLSIEGPSKAEINCDDNEDGTCTVEYLPTEPGKYTINIKFADEHVPGSPFHALVGGEAPIGRSSADNAESRTTEIFEDVISFGGPSAPEQRQHDLVVNLKGYNIEDLNASVISPSGCFYDAEVVETKDKAYTIRFVPKETGDYLINVKYRRAHIPGSPYKVHVDTSTWGGAQKCTAAGPGLQRGLVGKPCRFTVWTREAGPGGLAVAIEGPAKAEISCHDNGDGSCNIVYLPTEQGEYTVHVRFADQDIPGSPFKVPVIDEEDEKFRNLSVTDLAESGLKVGQSASFSVQTNGPVGKVNATVISPSGKESTATVSDLGGGNYAIRFVPNEFGDHLVNVRFDGVHIPGSPFKIRVGGAEGHPERVKAYGPGLESGRAGFPSEFTVNAVDAGSGALALSVDGPAKVKMNCAENADGTYQVTYNPMVAGDYQISIRFAGQQIPGSPYNVKIYPTTEAYESRGDASKCTSRGAGLHTAVIGQPNTFTVSASNAGRGSLMVGVEGPAIPAKEINVKHTGGNVYAVNYTLEETGEYVLQVLWSGTHIPGSPFHVTV